MENSQYIKMAMSIVNNDNTYKRLVSNPMEYLKKKH